MENLGLYIFLFLALFILLSSFFTVKQQTSAIVERFGKFQSIRHSGLQLKIPVIDKIAGKINLKIQQLDVIIETKTKDNVFVKLKVSVQFMVIKDKVYDAFYRLEYPHDQITAYVFDVVRAEVPKLRLDDVFERKDDIAIAVKRELNEAMTTYGYDIIRCSAQHLLSFHTYSEYLTGLSVNVATALSKLGITVPASISNARSSPSMR